MNLKSVPAEPLRAILIQFAHQILLNASIVKANHRTLVAKCPRRKEIVRIKKKERRARSRSAHSRDRGGLKTTMLITLDITTATVQTSKLIENYLAVMAVTITLAEKREVDC